MAKNESKNSLNDLTKVIREGNQKSAEDAHSTRQMMLDIAKIQMKQSANHAAEAKDAADAAGNNQSIFAGRTDMVGLNEKKEDKIEAKRERKGFFSSLKAMFKKQEGDKGEGMFSGITKTIKKVFGLLKLKFLLIGALVVGMISSLNMDQIKAIWNSLKEAFTAIVEFLTPIVKFIWNWIKESVLPNLIQFFVDTFKTIGETFTNIKEIFAGWTEMNFMEKVGAVFTALWEVVYGLGSIVGNIFAKVGAMFGLDGKFFKDLWENIKMIPGFLLDAMMGMEQAVADKFNEWMPDGIGAFLVNKVFTPFIDWFKTLFDFSSIRTSIESLINLPIRITNTIKEKLLDPAVTWIGDKFGFDTSSFTKFSIGELVMKGWDNIIGFLEEKFDIKWPDIKLPSPKEIIKMIAPAKDSVLWKVPGTGGIKSWLYGKEPDKPVEPVISSEPPKPNQLAKPQWAQREAAEWGRKNNKKPSDWTKAMGGFGKVKEMYGSYKSGDMAEPSKMPTSKSELDQIKKDEGFSRSVYKDTMGIKTIGYGFNLEREGAQEALDAAGIKKGVASLKHGRMKLTEEEASRLMMGEMGHFKKVAERFVGESTWKTIGADRQGILTNMAYNMGEGTLNKFKKLKAAIQKGDWKQAQAEMKDSSWAKQVHGRADRLVARMGGDEKASAFNSVQGQNNIAKDNSGQPIIVTNNIDKSSKVNSVGETTIAAAGTATDGSKMGKVLTS